MNIETGVHNIVNIKVGKPAITVIESTGRPFNYVEIVLTDAKGDQYTVCAYGPMGSTDPLTVEVE